VSKISSSFFKTLTSYKSVCAIPPCRLISAKVTLHFLGEQHGKGGVDQLFGWGCAWIESFLQEHPIQNLQDLLKCYRAGAQDMVNIDPNGPKFHIGKFDPGDERPQPRHVFQCPNFLVTRTYCLKAELMRGYAHGIRIVNKVFTDSDGQLLRHWGIEDKNIQEPAADDEQPQVQTWRRGFWPGERSWEGQGPLPGDVNELVRRHADQKTFLPQELPDLHSEEALLSRAVARLQKKADKKRRQTAALADAISNSSSSSSSSSASSSSDKE
jgi:hypothetical protein